MSFGAGYFTVCSWGKAYVWRPIDERLVAKGARTGMRQW